MAQHPCGNRPATDTHGLTSVSPVCVHAWVTLFHYVALQHVFKLRNVNPTTHRLCCSFLATWLFGEQPCIVPIFPTRKWRKEETRCPPGAAQLATVGVGTSKAAGDEGAGLGARPGSVGPGAPLGAASPQLWAPWTEAKGTAGRRPHCPPRIQPWSQAWGALGSGLVSGATCWSKCPPASGGGGDT